MSAGAPRPFVPGGHSIQQWAWSRGVAFDAFPEETWFRRWEPYDTISPPLAYVNAVTIQNPPGVVVLVEPWTAFEGTEPLDRTVLGFATHPGLRRKASIRAGEHFLTRVAFIESPPPPKVTVGDPVWDERVVTFARSAEDAAAAFHPRLRALLSGWGFEGHLELRAGGVVCHVAGLAPVPEGYSRMRRMLLEVVATALR